MYVRVTVYPGEKRETVERISENLFKMRVKEPAERNLANKKVIELLQRELGAKKVKLVAGHRSHRKTFRVEGMKEEEEKKDRDDTGPVLQF